MENLNEEKINSSNNKNNTQQKSNNNKMNNQNLNSNQKEDPYINIIKNNPEFLFDFLSNDRIKMWESVLIPWQLYQCSLIFFHNSCITPDSEPIISTII